MPDRPQLLFVFAGPGPPDRRWLTGWLKLAKHLRLRCVHNAQDDPWAWRGWARRPHPGSEWTLTSSAATPAACSRLLAESLAPGEVGVVLPREVTPEEVSNG